MAGVFQKWQVDAQDQALLQTLEQLSQGAAFFDTQSDVLLAFNAPFVDLWPGLEDLLQPGALFGEVLLEIWDRGLADILEGEDKPAWLQRMAQEHRTLDTPMIRRLPDGRAFQLKKTITQSGHLLCVAQQMNSAEALRHQDEARSSVMEGVARAIADWFWETDAEHRFVHPGGVGDGMGGHLTWFLGKTRWEACSVDPDQDPHWYQHRETLFRQQAFRDFRYQHLTPDGRLRRSRISGYPRFGPDGAFLGYRGIGIDETAAAEASLRADEAEAILDDAVRNLNQGIAIMDGAMKLRLWNLSFERYFGDMGVSFYKGISFQEIMRRLAYSGRVKEAQDDPEAWLQRRLSLPVPAPGVFERQMGGQWFQIRETTMSDGGMLVSFTEITELKQREAELIETKASLEGKVAERTQSLEEALENLRQEAAQRAGTDRLLRENETRFRAIAEGTISPIYVQSDFKLYYCNQAAVDILGYDSRDELLQIDSVADFLAPSVREELVQRNADRSAGKEAPPRYQTLFLRKDGTEFWVELFVSKITWEGQPAILVSVVDIDDQRKAQQALTQAESDYRAIFEQVSDGIFRNTLDGRTLRVNPALARMNGFKDEAEVFAERPDVNRKWYVEDGRREEFIRELMEKGEVINFVSEVYRYKSRERIWVSENAYLVRDENGEPLYVEGTMRDITEQRNVELNLRRAIEEAERANYAKTQFLAKMSHELRTPLNAIIGFSEVMTGEMLGPMGSERYVQYAEDIQMSGRHLLDLINDLLDLSKIEAGAMSLNLEPVPVEPAVAEALDWVRVQAETKAVTLEMQIGGEALMADPRGFKQMLLNLLSNAVKFNREGGWVRVCGAADGEMYRLTIADGGVGIDARDRERLFEPFGQIENQLVAEQKGSGLGLPIVKALAELHGGEISIDSTPGEGTEVLLILPLAP